MLDVDLEPGTDYDVWISLGKAGGEDVRIGWELIIADAPSPVPLASVDFLEELEGHDHSDGFHR